MYNFLKIDELLRKDHHYLTEEDICYYFMEYTSRAGYQHSPANNLIHNFKKPTKYRGQAPWKYKQQAIRQVGEMFQSSLKGRLDLAEVTLVPIPPSKMKNSPAYDGRMLQALQVYTAGQPSDVRELLVINADMEATHETDDRMSPAELIPYLAIDEDNCRTPVKPVILFDDVLTTGSHYVACRRVLQHRFPGLNVNGVFVARTIWPSPFDDFMDVDFSE